MSILTKSQMKDFIVNFIYEKQNKDCIDSIKYKDSVLLHILKGNMIYECELNDFLESMFGITPFMASINICVLFVDILLEIMIYAKCNQQVIEYIKSSCSKLIKQQLLCIFNSIQNVGRRFTYRLLMRMLYDAFDDK